MSLHQITKKNLLKSFFALNSVIAQFQNKERNYLYYSD